MWITTDTKKFVELGQLIDDIEHLSDADMNRLIVREIHGQSFGWPAGRSEYFTWEAGRWYSLVSHNLTTVGFVASGPLGKEEFTDKAQLIAFLSRPTHLWGWEVVLIEEFWPEFLSRNKASLAKCVNWSPEKGEFVEEYKYHPLHYQGGGGNIQAFKSLPSLPVTAVAE